MADISSHHHRPIPSYNGTKPYIFISYSHAYRSLVRYMSQILGEMGYRVCSDGGIGQSEMPEEYYKRIENCSVYVVILSPRTVASQRVRNEMRHISHRSKVLLLSKKRTALDPECSHLLSRGKEIRARRKCKNDSESLAEYMVKKLVPHLPEGVRG